jgi:hypothetical protein
MDRTGHLLQLAIGMIVIGVIANLLGLIEIQTWTGLSRLPLVPGFALTFSEIVLLAFWAVFSTGPIWRRLILTVLALAGLELLFDLMIDGEFMLMPCVAMVLIFLALLVVRWFGFRLLGQDQTSDLPPEALRFQFSIRNIMALTVVVALLSSGVRTVQDSPALSMMGQSAVWAACFVGVGLLTILAMLRRERPLVWCLVTYGISPTLGACFAYAMQAHREVYIYITLIMLIYPTILLGSLALVRSTGVRLVRTRGQADTGAERT